MCGGDMSPYSVMSVARNLCWGPDKRSAEGAEIETPKASRREAYGDTPPQLTRTTSGGLEERRKFPTGVRGRAPAENEFWNI